MSKKSTCALSVSTATVPYTEEAASDASAAKAEKKSAQRDAKAKLDDETSAVAAAKAAAENATAARWGGERGVRLRGVFRWRGCWCFAAHSGGDLCERGDEGDVMKLNTTGVLD